MKFIDKFSYVCILLLYGCGKLSSLDLENMPRLGAPPMGWLSWERFKCNLKCDVNPEDCISEKLFMTMADILVNEGYRDAGYVFFLIDDCGMAPSRSSNGRLPPDPVRFPHGLEYLLDYMLARGLILGLFQNYGFRTCMGFPGLIGHMEENATAFAEKEVDMVKIDDCFTPTNHFENGFMEMGDLFKKTKIPKVYSCSWPYYQILTHIIPDYQKMAAHCNMWRNFYDIQDSWESIERIIDFFGDYKENIASHTRLGRWSDPNMLMIGNSGLTAAQSRAQMAMWCVIPIPLLMSNDLRNISTASKDILLNSKAIAINQDFLNIPGRRIFQKDLLEVWRKPIEPVLHKRYSFALVFLNRHHSGKIVEVNFEELGLTNKKGYFVTKVFDKKDHGVVYKRYRTFNLFVPGIDAVMLNCKVVI